MKKLFGSLAIVFLSIGIMMTSCTKEEVWSDVDNFVFDNYKHLCDSSLGGHHRCYKVVFPVTILFPDSTELEVFSREELITALKNWKESGPTVDGRPTVEFPITVERLDSVFIEVNSVEEAKELKRECHVFNHKHRAAKHFAKFINNKCFEVQLPIGIVMADGEIIEITKRRDIVKVLKEWKKDRPEEVPEIVFPITINVKEDDTKVEVLNMEELELIIAECKE